MHEPVCRICRRHGRKLFLKGEKCFSQKCPVSRRTYPPGQHGPTLRVKISDYGKQLFAKQRAKAMYGLRDEQFSRYFNEAVRHEGDTGENLVRMLEMRLDNILYRAGFASSRPLARQMVTHGHVTLNGKRASIPSIIVRPNDRVQVSGPDVFMRGQIEELPSWLKASSKGRSAEVLHTPATEEMPQEIDRELIVEFFNR